MPLLAQLRPLRLSRGLTQADLAERAGLDRTTISKAETGDSGLRVDTAERLFDLLEADIIAVSRSADDAMAPGLPKGFRPLLRELAEVLPHLPRSLRDDLQDRVSSWRRRYLTDSHT